MKNKYILIVLLKDLYEQEYEIYVHLSVLVLFGKQCLWSAFQLLCVS
jgi:hypothetical protein